MVLAIPLTHAAMGPFAGVKRLRQGEDTSCIFKQLTM